MAWHIGYFRFWACQPPSPWHAIASGQDASDCEINVDHWRKANKAYIGDEPIETVVIPETAGPPRPKEGEEAKW